MEHGENEHTVCPRSLLWDFYYCPCARCRLTLPTAPNLSTLLCKSKAALPTTRRVVTSPGTFDTFDPSDPAGQRLHGDHAYVFHQVPVKARSANNSLMDRHPFESEWMLSNIPSATTLVAQTRCRANVRMHDPAPVTRMSSITASVTNRKASLDRHPPDCELVPVQ